MKYLMLFVITCVTPLLSFSQFDEEKVASLATMKNYLGNGWTTEVVIENDYWDLDEYPVIFIDICNDKTQEDNVNVCLEVLVFDIADKDFVLHRVSTIENGVEILYTKSYIIIISYVEYWNRTYNKMLPDVLNEITEFFEANKENL